MKDMYSPLDEAKYNVVHDYSGGAVKLGPLVNIKPAVLSNKVNPTLETHHLMVDEAIAIQAVTRDYRILYAEAAALNHTCIPLTDFTGISDIELLTAYAKVHAELGETAQAISAAFEDGRITGKEFMRITKEQDEDIRAMFELRARLEALIDD